MDPRLASFLAAVACIPAFFYLTYRSLAPYEATMPGHRIGGSMFYPGIAGFALGIVHATMDPSLIGAGYGGLSYLVLYPLIETYMLIVIFNRTFFFKQPATPVYFGMGGGALALGMAFVEVYRSLLVPSPAYGDFGLFLVLAVLATAFVLFHASKGLILGTYYAVGSRRRGVLVTMLLEAPFGALLLTAHFPQVDAGPLVALLVIYAAVLYYFTWHLFFQKRMPEELRQAITQERKRARRVALAKERK